MPTQTEAGKAFEYAILKAAYDILSVSKEVIIIQNSSYSVALGCFTLFEPKAQAEYYSAAEAAIKHIIKLEPRLVHSVSNDDILTLQIVSNSDGIRGDVRDVLFIRSTQNWQIGISAKNNHMAVKHSRLSNTIDFGHNWLNLKCSEHYFKVISPIFEELAHLRDRKELWRNLNNKASNSMYRFSRLSGKN